MSCFTVSLLHRIYLTRLNRNQSEQNS